MSKHYHVIVNVPGYLSEQDEPYIYATEAEAIESLREEVERTVEGYEGALGDEDVQVEQVGTPEEGYVHVSDAKQEHDLGVVHEIIECEDPECEVDDEQA